MPKTSSTSRPAEIPSTGFNAATPYLNAFTTAAIIGTAIKVYEGVEELKKISSHLKGINKELGILASDKIQGWGPGGFGEHVYRTLKMEIDTHGCGKAVNGHVFYVWNPDTSWHTTFKRKVQDNPLSPAFGGFSSDLEGIFLLMWANRRMLSETIPGGKGDQIRFHLLIPAYTPIIVRDEVQFDPRIGKLTIKSDIQDGTPLMWFNFVPQHLPPAVRMQNIGNLNLRNLYDQEKSANAKAAVGFWTTTVVGISASAFLPVVGPLLALGGAAGFVDSFATDVTRELTREYPTPRVLGRPSISK